MDKVINGVDVSECKNFIPVYTEDTDIEINNCCTLTYTPCQFEKKDCYYKQLQKLKHQYADVLKLAKENADSNEYCLQELEQENEQIKKDYAKLHIDFAKYNEENEQLYNDLIECGIKREQYRQALQEIRDMATLFHSVNENKDLDRFKNNILAKINEVIGAE